MLCFLIFILYPLNNRPKSSASVNDRIISISKHYLRIEQLKSPLEAGRQSVLIVLFLLFAIRIRKKRRDGGEIFRYSRACLAKREMCSQKSGKACRENYDNKKKEKCRRKQASEERRRAENQTSKLGLNARSAARACKEAMDFVR